MIRPPVPRFTMAPPRCFMQRNVLVRLRSMSCCHCARVCSASGTLMRLPPTLLMRMSMGPCRSSTCWQINSHSAGWLTSPGISTAIRPSLRMSAAVAANDTASRPTSTTSAPASAMAKAISRPSPRLPPVMKRRFPVSLNRSNMCMMTCPAESTHLPPARSRRTGRLSTHRPMFAMLAMTTSTSTREETDSYGPKWITDPSRQDQSRSLQALRRCAVKPAQSNPSPCPAYFFTSQTFR